MESTEELISKFEETKGCKFTEEGKRAAECVLELFDLFCGKQVSKQDEREKNKQHKDAG